MWESTSVSGAKETWRKIVISTQVIALMESNEAQRDASLAANRIFQESWVPWKMASVCNGAVTKNIC